MTGMTVETLMQLKADLEVLQLDILPSVERLHSVVGDSFVLKMQLIVGRLATHIGTLESQEPMIRHAPMAPDDSQYRWSNTAAPTGTVKASK